MGWKGDLRKCTGTMIYRVTKMVPGQSRSHICNKCGGEYGFRVGYKGQVSKHPCIYSI